MDKIEDGKYSVFLRKDYLKELHKIRGSSERDNCIQRAILEYLELPDDARRRETERQTIDVLALEGVARDYTMLLDIAHIPDEIAERLLPYYVHSGVDLDRMVNTAIRLWLQARKIDNLRV
jgi:hypothetical protein